MPRTKKQSADKRRRIQKELKRKNDFEKKESNSSFSTDNKDFLNNNLVASNETNCSNVLGENNSEAAIKEKERKRRWIEKMRKQEDFKRNELEANKMHARNLRTDENYRHKEKNKNKLYIQDLRTNEQHIIQERQRNKEHINSLRSLEEFKSIEQKKNKERISSLRSLEEFKSIEQKKNKERINSLRSLEEFKSIEQEKNKKRMNSLRSLEEYKSIEQEKNKERMNSLRSDETYKNRELKINKERIESLRSDDEYRVQELEANKNLREKKISSNEIYKNKVRESNKNRKRKQRDDSNYRENEKKKDKELKRKKTESNSMISNILHHTSVVDPQRKSLIELFKEGPTQVCSCCHRLWFPRKCYEIEKDAVTIKFGKQFWVDLFSHNKEKYIICNSCKNIILSGKVPKLCAKNYKVAFPIPQELKGLTTLEERLVSPRIPFMQINTLGYNQQCSIKGQIVNVPINVDTTVNKLPRNINDTYTIQLKLKRNMKYKGAYLYETVRPTVIRNAAKYLIEQPLYKAQEITLSETWESNNDRSANKTNSDHNISDVMCSPVKVVEENPSLHTSAECMVAIPNNNEVVQEDSLFLLNTENVNTVQYSLAHMEDKYVQMPINSKTISENNIPHEWERFSQTESLENELNQLANLIEEFDNEDMFEELNPGNNETLLEDNNYIENIALAPGEGQKPIHLLYDEYAEELSFPTIFCGNAKEFKTKMSYNDIARLQAAYFDRRFARTDFLLYMYKKLQLFQIITQINVAMRKKIEETDKYTVKEVKSREFLNRLIQHDAAYMFLARLTSAPAHWQKEKNKLMAMIRQFNIPTMFVTITAAETMWPELLVILTKVVQNKNISEDEALKLSHQEKCFLIRSDPVTCSRYFDNRFHLLLGYMKSTDGPFKDNPIIHYYYRVEIQQRGSPHIHMLLWLSNPPMFNASDEESVKKCEEFIQKYITCDSSLQSVKDIIHYQVHRHAKNCKREIKGIITCRYGMPFLPFDKTTILSPSDKTLTREQLKESRDIFNNIKKLLCNSKDEQIPFNEFLYKLNLTREQYIMNIKQNITRPTVFLKREVKDCFVNAFNEDIFSLQRSNMDIQFILDPYACCSYIVNYINKSERGVSKMMRDTMTEIRNGDKDIKEQLKCIGNAFINASEVSAQEAAYALLKLHMSETSTSNIFINTKPVNERVRILKSKADLNLLEDEDTNIYQTGIIEHYIVRPDSLENLCLAEFGAYFIFSKYDENKHSGKNFLRLKDNSGILTKKKAPKIISYNRYGVQQDPTNFYRQQLMLFTPWRNEERDLINIDQEQVYMALIDQIKENRKKFDMLDTSILDDAYDLAEKHAQDMLEDSNTPELDPEYQVYGIDNPEIDVLPNEENVQNTDKQTFPTPFQISNEDYEELISSLNMKQYEYLTHILKKIKTNQVIFEILSGGAGVGKSRLIQAIYQSLLRHYNSIAGNDPTTIKVLLTAPTGKAAFNIGGLTLHSSFSLPVTQHNEDMIPLSRDTVNSVYTKLANLKLIIIDEYSMMGSNMFHHLNARLQQIFKSRKDFADISILLVGDLRQLSPVGDRWIFLPTYKNPYSDISGTHLWDKFKYFELTEIMRQRDDKKFAISLNNMAEGVMTKNDLDLFASRKMSGDERLPENTIHLFRSNREVDDFNEKKLSEYTTQKVLCQASDVVKGSCSDKMKKLLLNYAQGLKKADSFGLMYNLTLQVNAKYMISINLNVQDGIVNGATGILRKIDLNKNNEPNRVWIEFSEETVGRQTRAKHHGFMTANNIPKTWTPLERTARALTIIKNSSATVERKQFPLFIAEAITVHKSQGSTYINVAVHIDKGIQRSALYVACSRAVSLSGLYIYGEFHAPRKPSLFDKNYIELQTLRSQKALKTEFQKQFYATAEKLIITYQNVQSFKKNAKFISNNPLFIKSDIMVLVETWVNVQDDITLKNYACFVNICNKEKHKPFGILCYRRQNLETELIKEIVISDNFCSLQGVIFKCQNTFVIAVYIPPKFKITVARNILKDIIENTKGNCIIIGDFNHDLMLDENNAIKKLLMENNFVSVLHMNASTTKQSTHIDWCFANFPQIRSNIYETIYSHHKAIATTIYKNGSDVPSQFSNDIDPNNIDSAQKDLEVQFVSDEKVANIQNDILSTEALTSDNNSESESESSSIENSQSDNEELQLSNDADVAIMTPKNLKHVKVQDNFLSSVNSIIHGPLQNNDGVSCYANATLHMLFELEELRTSVLRQDSDVNRELTKILQKEVNVTVNLRSIVNETFTTNHQQDVIEFVSYLLPKLNNDFLELIKVYIADHESCSSCTYENYTNPIENNYYSIGVPKRRNHVMQFSELFDCQHSGQLCRVCNNESLQTRSVLDTCNKYLILGLIRTDFEDGRMVKINTTFTNFNHDHVSIYGMDFFVRGVIKHIGSEITSGHYLCEVKQADGKWLKCNDMALSYVTFDTSLADVSVILLERK